MGLTKRIIPCLDVKAGRVVKGIRFQHLRDAGDPVALAKAYNDQGADEVVFLDISATIEQRKSLIDAIKRTADEVFIPLTVGGGIRSLDDIGELLKAGADKVSINTAAVERPELIREAAEVFGSQCIVVAIDVKRKTDGGWEVVTHSGTKPRGIDALEWAKTVEELGAGEILLTSMDMDGTKKGYDIELTRAVSSTVNIPVIASGGAGTADDIFQVLTFGQADAALAASIFHYGEFTVTQLKKLLYNRGVPVRYNPGCETTIHAHGCNR